MKEIVFVGGLHEGDGGRGSVLRVSDGEVGQSCKSGEPDGYQGGDINSSFNVCRVNPAIHKCIAKFQDGLSCCKVSIMYSFQSINTIKCLLNFRYSQMFVML